MMHVLPQAPGTRRQCPIKSLLKTCDYTRVRTAGLCARMALFKMWVLHNSLAETRLGVVVSKRVSHKAVARNRVKRVIRHAVSEGLPGALRQSHDIVVLALPGASGPQGITRLRSELAQTLNKWTSKTT